MFAVEPVWVNGLVNIIVGQHHGTSGYDRSSAGWRRRRMYLCRRRLKRKENKEACFQMVRGKRIKRHAGNVNLNTILIAPVPRPTFAKGGPAGGNVCGGELREYGFCWGV